MDSATRPETFLIRRPKENSTDPCPTTSDHTLHWSAAGSLAFHGLLAAAMVTMAVPLNPSPRATSAVRYLLAEQPDEPMEMFVEAIPRKNTRNPAGGAAPSLPMVVAAEKPVTTEAAGPSPVATDAVLTEGLAAPSVTGAEETATGTGEGAEAGAVIGTGSGSGTGLSSGSGLVSGSGSGSGSGTGTGTGTGTEVGVAGGVAVSDLLAQYKADVGRRLRDAVERRFQREARRQDDGVVLIRVTLDRNGLANITELSSASELLKNMVTEAVRTTRHSPVPSELASPVSLAYRFKFKLK